MCLKIEGKLILANYFLCHLSVFSLKFTIVLRTVEFTMAPDTPIYNQYKAVFFTRRAVILAKNQPVYEASQEVIEN